MNFSLSANMSGFCSDSHICQFTNKYQCASESVFCIVRKNWPYSPIVSGSYGRKGSRPADKIWVDFKILKFSTG